MRRALLMIMVAGVLAAVAAPVDSSQSNATTGHADAMRALDEASSELAELQKIHADTVQTAEKMSALYRALDKNVAAFTKLAAEGGTRPQLLAAARQMQETQMSFNLQYLQLQNQMQNENRSYTAVSNLMKTKHDTVKNAIGNIR